MPIVRSGIQVALVGSASAGIGYLIGRVVSSIAG
jgi:hypothetical protein